MMNTAARPPSPMDRAARPQEASHAPETPGQREHADRFDRILRHKMGARGEADDEQREAEQPHAPEGMAVAPLAPHRGLEVPPPCGPLLDIAPVAQAAFAAARAADVAPLRTDTASDWQLSLHEPLGVAIEMRATRAAVPTAAVPAPWTLTLSSSGLDAGLLGRHVPRLDERLRKRVATQLHVRIEGDDEAMP
ncbi:hypothetical protein [Piscinibacter sp. XHJ-5]|uniref:hypothetical protein n=1 Tax=Piscinibacter sp. XHJ-5 TaxID=3037797 RepID=UPI002452BFE3|nr:hypothetical protein [Piscinibacter sp. XHJ-5]